MSSPPRNSAQDHSLTVVLEVGLGCLLDMQMKATCRQGVCCQVTLMGALGSETHPIIPFPLGSPNARKMARAV